jgi:hypothetical protein
MQVVNDERILEQCTVGKREEFGSSFLRNLIMSRNIFKRINEHKYRGCVDYTLTFI